MTYQRTNYLLAARAEGRKAATGMTREQVAEQIEAARMWQRLVEKTDDGYPQRHKTAEQQHREWRRIGHVLDETPAMAVYEPAADPQVQRWAEADARAENERASQ